MYALRSTLVLVAVVNAERFQLVEKVARRFVVFLLVGLVADS